jgi:hypothetical protein
MLRAEFQNFVSKTISKPDFGGKRNTSDEWFYYDPTIQLAWSVWQKALVTREKKNPTRERINAIGQELRNFREKYDTVSIIQIESVPACPDTLNVSFRVTVNDGYRSATSHAVELYDAFYAARYQLKEAITETLIETVEVEKVNITPSVPKLKIDPSKLKVPGSAS